MPDIVVRRLVPAGLALLLRPHLRGAGGRAGLRAQGRPVRLVAGARAGDPAARGAAGRRHAPTSRPAPATGSRCRSPAGSPRCRCRATRPPSTRRRAGGCSRSSCGRCGRSSGSAPSSSAWAAGRSTSPTGSSQGNLDAGSGYDPDGRARGPRAVRPRRGPRRDRHHRRASRTPSVRSARRPTACAPSAPASPGSHVAGVSRQRHRARTSRPTEAPDGEVTTAVTGAVDLAAPRLGLPRPRVGARPRRRAGPRHRRRRRRRRAR